MGAFTIAPAQAALSRLIAVLPAGKTLPPELWRRRHHTMVWLVWAHVAGVENDEDHAIVKAVIRLAESLGLAAVAEGVERLEQAQELGQLSCAFAQGYHFARPQDPDAISALLSAAATASPPAAG